MDLHYEQLRSANGHKTVRKAEKQIAGMDERTGEHNMRSRAKIVAGMLLPTMDVGASIAITSAASTTPIPANLVG